MKFNPAQPLKLKAVALDGDGVLTDASWPCTDPAGIPIGDKFTLSQDGLHAVAQNPGTDAFIVRFKATNDLGAEVNASLDLEPINPTTRVDIEPDTP